MSYILFCEWKLEDRIPFDQKTSALQYQRLHTDFDDCVFDSIVYDRQTMTVVPVANGVSWSRDTKGMGAQLQTMSVCGMQSETRLFKFPEGC